MPLVFRKLKPLWYIRIKHWWRTKRHSKLVIQMGPGIKIYQFYPTAYATTAEDMRKEKKLVEGDLYYFLRFYGEPIGCVQAVSFSVGIGSSHKKLVKYSYEYRHMGHPSDAKIIKRLAQLRKYCEEYGIELIELEYPTD